MHCYIHTQRIQHTAQDVFIFIFIIIFELIFRTVRSLEPTPRLSVQLRVRRLGLGLQVAGLDHLKAQALVGGDTAYMDAGMRYKMRYKIFRESAIKQDSIYQQTPALTQALTLILPLT